jgi:hypothetical protein
MLKNLLLVAIASALITSPVNAQLDKELGFHELDQTTELKLMKRICLMVSQDVTYGEFKNEMLYLIAINSRQLADTLLLKEIPGSNFNELARSHNKEIEALDITGNLKTLELLTKKVIANNCNF